MADYISRKAAIEVLRKYKVDPFDTGFIDDTIYGFTDGIDTAISELSVMPAADVRPVPPGGIGEMSDGYHTFNGLYYQRMVLFAALVKQNKDSAWKSHRHEDGELCFGGGWFIVGLDTPKGSYTYHYEDKDWDLFDCEELPVGKHWDGHTEDDVTRLLSLPEMRPAVRGKWEKVGEQMLINLENARTCRWKIATFTDMTASNGSPQRMNLGRCKPDKCSKKSDCTRPCFPREEAAEKWNRREGKQ